MKNSTILSRRILSILLFLPTILFIFHIQKSVVQLYDSKTTDAELLEKITAMARPISLSSPSSSPNRFVLMTAGTYSYRDYITNMACSFQRHTNNGTYNFQILLLSLDLRLHNFPMPSNVHSIYLKLKSKELSGKEPAAHFGQRGFDTVTRQKFAAVRAVLSAGFDLLYTDGDVVWCDPSRAVMDIASQADPRNAPIVTQSATNPGQVMNTGLFYMVSSSGTRNFAYATENFPAKLTNDQGSANNLACKKDYGGVRLGRDHCRWRKTDIRILEPKNRYILGASRIAGITRITATEGRDKGWRKQDSGSMTKKDPVSALRNKS